MAYPETESASEHCRNAEQLLGELLEDFELLLEPHEPMSWDTVVYLANDRAKTLRAALARVVAARQAIELGRLTPAPPGPVAYVCAVCHRNPVAAEAGYDTCADCLARQ